MLSQEQVETFENEGVLVVEDVLEPRILDSLKEEYSDLLDQLYSGWQNEGLVPDGSGLDFYGKLLVSYEAGCNWYQPLDISLPLENIKADTPFHFGPAVFDMLTSERLLDLVEDLIGPEITSNPIQHVRLKPPSKRLRSDEFGSVTNSLITNTEWHQDKAVALEDADNTTMVTVWLAMTDVTVDSGCLQVVPGKPQMYPHCPKKQTSIADGYLDESKAVPLPVRAGGVVLFHPLTPHSSKANETDSFRWSFDIRFNVTGQSTGRTRFPEFVARSKADPKSVLNDWQIWKDMWMKTRANLSKQEHVPFHRWKADSPVCA